MPSAPTYEPAVSVKRSITPNALISLIDGKSYKALKRHLSAQGLTPTEYRTRYGLPADYPMVAPSYATKRSEMAIARGFGRKSGTEEAAAPAPEPVKAEAPKKRGRPAKKVAAK